MGGLELIPTLTALVARMSRSQATPALACVLKLDTCRSTQRKIVETCLDDTSRPVSRSVAGSSRSDADKSIL